MLFFFKQKTAYEMRISDWSSDVCSSDLQTTKYEAFVAKTNASVVVPCGQSILCDVSGSCCSPEVFAERRNASIASGCSPCKMIAFAYGTQIGRASCRERVCQYV